MKNKIIDFYKMNDIDIEIKETIKGLQLETFYLIIKDYSIKNINKILRLKSALCLYCQKDNINISLENSSGTIKIEIPTEENQIFTYKDLTEQATMKNNGLFINIGINTYNNIEQANICDFPHLLIAGTTGSGKSVLVNTFIMQLLENYTIEELELLLIDIKQVEFNIYKNIPHLIRQPISDFEQCRATLNNCIEEMNKRYEILSNSQCRNIQEYNQKNDEKMKYRVIVIDELAELLMLEKNSKLKASLEGLETIEKTICRIAQLGRASGIHLIVATQRPSSDIISGLIKSNIPSRICLSVANSTNSRVVLDETGAENLNGKGDLLYKLIGTKTKRLQGAFINETEIQERLQKIKNKYTYNNIIQEIPKKDILKELENYLNERFKNSKNKNIAYNCLQKREIIDILLKDLCKTEEEQNIVNENYFKILEKVKKYYNGYITEEKEQYKQEIKQAREDAKIKRRDRLLTYYFINKGLTAINKMF